MDIFCPELPLQIPSCTWKFGMSTCSRTSRTNLIIRNWFWIQRYQNINSFDFFPFLLQSLAKSSKKLTMGHVQDTPVSSSIISNECMICHMKVHIVSYNLDQIFFSKSKIHILPNYERTDLKTAIVIGQKSL